MVPNHSELTCAISLLRCHYNGWVANSRCDINDESMNCLYMGPDLPSHPLQFVVLLSPLSAHRSRSCGSQRRSGSRPTYQMLPVQTYRNPSKLGSFLHPHSCGIRTVEFSFFAGQPRRDIAPRILKVLGFLRTTCAPRTQKGRNRVKLAVLCNTGSTQITQCSLCFFESHPFGFIGVRR